LKDIAREEDDGFGNALWDDGTFRRKVSQTEIELMTLEVQMMRLLSAVSADREMGFEASMIKIRRSEILQRLTELKMEAVGYYSSPYIKAALTERWTLNTPMPRRRNTLTIASIRSLPDQTRSSTISLRSACLDCNERAWVWRSAAIKVSSLLACVSGAVRLASKRSRG